MLGKGGSRRVTQASDRRIEIHRVAPAMGLLRGVLSLPRACDHPITWLKPGGGGSISHDPRPPKKSEVYSGARRRFTQRFTQKFTPAREFSVPRSPPEICPEVRSRSEYIHFRVNLLTPECHEVRCSGAMRSQMPRDGISDPMRSQMPFPMNNGTRDVIEIPYAMRRGTRCHEVADAMRSQMP